MRNTGNNTHDAHATCVSSPGFQSEWLACSPLNFPAYSGANPKPTAALRAQECDATMLMEMTGAGDKIKNTQKLNEWIPKIISETERELVIIVPYIKASVKVYQQLCEANSRGVETILVYREDQLSKSEKQRFSQLDNLNLFCHPNVHCKCYYNEKYLLITSMNMYEYSELNNREMGILLQKEDCRDNVFTDAVDEIRDIIKSSRFEKKSRETINKGLIFAIIKTDKEKAEDESWAINKHFHNKTFEACISPNNTWSCKRLNYHDRINVIHGDNRFQLELNYDEDCLEKIYNKFKQYNQEYAIKGHKLYWSYHKSNISLYKDKRFPQWNVKNEQELYDVWQDGLDKLVKHLRNFF
ncbi:MAG: hypothetical protein JWQ09_3467 [Segetibacter sp.]|nr:hypothetical protein [Segetibacter sp.]